MSRLLTISDLNQPAEVLEPLIQRAQQLSSHYFEYISEDMGGFDYQVHVSSETGRKGGIHASEMSKCFRKAVYSILNTERKVAKGRKHNMIMRFRIGTAVHGMLQHDFRRMADGMKYGIEFQPEVEISPEIHELAREFHIHSSCDGIFTIYDEALKPIIRVGLEIKTASDKEFDKLKAPYPDHIEQSTLYQAVLDIPLMWTLYYNKANSNITTSYSPWLFKFDHQLWDKLQMRFVKMHHLAVVNELPSKEESIGCEWCPYSYTCQPDYLKAKQPAPISDGMGVRKRR